MSKTLVIVESPTKAKTLKKFLGSDYVVESSVGHIRDLPANASEVPADLKKEAWSRLGVDVEHDFKPLYIVQPEKKKKITELKAALKTVDALLLATDEDREGEAISWHLVEVLQPKVPYKRMVFHEITKSAILEAVQATREIDSDLVEAQEGRRIIDRLYGYEVSPVLWRKIGPRLSAGRVQSVAIKMLVDRERARMRFRTAEYWDLVATFRTDEQKTFEARLISLDGQRVASGKDFDPDTGKLVRADAVLVDAARAAALAKALDGQPFNILSAEEKPFTRSPAPPFTTSTLQQEGSRKLRFDAKRTMRAAQRLYENGHITYMRTDSVVLSTTAIELARTTISKTYGDEFLPPAPRTYKGKVQNAQEAHEAIRPAGESIVSVDSIRMTLGVDEAKIYDLVVKRTLASQMKDARGRRMTLKVGGRGGDADAVFQATGQVIDFMGFLKAYVEDTDEPAEGDDAADRLLPPVRQGDAVSATELTAEEHHTIPPARLTEATLVKMLEEEGIGRPSTYASIIDTILRREYSFKKGTALVPTFTAFAVVALMEQHLSHLIDSKFTAKMEARLDAISRGEDKMLPYLRDFYSGGIDQAPGLRPLLDAKVEAIDARTICTIPIGADEAGREVIVRVGRFGPFVQREEATAQIPDQTCPDELTVAAAEQLLAAKEQGDKPLGHHPESGKPIFVKTGRYGPYVQVGTADDDEKPKMVSLLRGMTPETLDLATALELASLPRVIGQDEAGVDIVASNGRYGPYIKRGSDTRSLTAEDDLLKVDLARALELLAQEKRGRARGVAEPIKVYENIPELDGKSITLNKGRYGPYITDGEVNASLPRGIEDPTTLTVPQALELLAAARERQGSKRKVTKKKATAKKAAKKTTKKVADGEGGDAPKAAKKVTKKKSAKKAAKKTTKKAASSTKASAGKRASGEGPGAGDDE
ncbi:MAG: type I DNA topoisomerase [Planctomycetota bacterium]